MYTKYDVFVNEGILNFLRGRSDPKNWINEMTLKEKLAHFLINDYEVLKDGSVNINQDCKLYDNNTGKIPFKINIVKGYFDCRYSELTSLKNGPKEVYGDFICSHNKLTSLEYGPKYVRGWYTFVAENKIDINNIENYPLCIIDYKHITNNNGKKSVISGIFQDVFNIVENNRNLFIPLLDNKIKFHQMIMRLNPELIKFYSTINPPTKKSSLLI